MEALLERLPKDQIAYVESQVAAGNYSDSIACVQSLLDEAIRLRERKEIDKKLLVAMDQYDRGECGEWTKEDRKRLLESV